MGGINNLDKGALRFPNSSKVNLYNNVEKEPKWQSGLISVSCEELRGCPSDSNIDENKLLSENRRPEK